MLVKSVFFIGTVEVLDINLIISDVAPQSRTEKEKLGFLFDLWRKYQSSQITRERYIRCVGYKYQARTDM
jgi:hypothetical protein